MTNRLVDSTVEKTHNTPRRMWKTRGKTCGKQILEKQKNQTNTGQNPVEKGFFSNSKLQPETLDNCLKIVLFEGKNHSVLHNFPIVIHRHADVLGVSRGEHRAAFINSQPSTGGNPNTRSGQ